MNSILVLEAALKAGNLNGLYYIHNVDGQIGLWSIKRDKPVAVGLRSCIRFLEKFTVRPSKNILGITFSQKEEINV